jgi:hypothetical protein
LVDAVGPSGEVVGVEISPEIVINAKRRIEENRWSNVQVIEADARTATLKGKFNGLLSFAAADIYASSQAVANLFPYLNDDARVVAFGAKLSHRRVGKVLNLLFRSLWKLSFSSTPALNHEPWAPLKNRVDELHVQEYFFGCMFLAWGFNKCQNELAHTAPAGLGEQLRRCPLDGAGAGMPIPSLQLFETRGPVVVPNRHPRPFHRLRSLHRNHLPLASAGRSTDFGRRAGGKGRLHNLGQGRSLGPPDQFQDFRAFALGARRAGVFDTGGLWGLLACLGFLLRRGLGLAALGGFLALGAPFLGLAPFL